jgi:hypothetical protein
MGKKRTDQPDAPLTSILPKQFVIALAVVAFLVASLLFGFGLVWPEKFANPTARFILCGAIALNLAVFFFVLYPQKLELSKIPYINLTIHLVGPIVLYIVMLLLLWKMMPEPSFVTYRFFVPYEENKRAERISGQARVTSTEEGFTCYVVPDENGLLAGVCVKFETGKDQYKASFKAPYYKTIDVTFRRGSGEGAFDVERMTH